MKKSSKFINILLTLTYTLTLSGCFDLGLFGQSEHGGGVAETNYKEYYKSYYDSFGDIYLYSQNKSSEKYTFKDDFFTKETVEELKSPCDANEYIMMAFEMKKDINLDSIAMYVKASGDIEGEKRLDVYLYILDMEADSFEDIPNYIGDDQIYKTDKDGEYIYDVDGNITYVPHDLPSKEKAVGSATLNVSKYTWNSFSIGTFKGDKGSIELKEGKCVVLAFYNNTGYQREINKVCDEVDKRPYVSIQVTNCLIRDAKSPERATG